MSYTGFKQRGLVSVRMFSIGWTARLVVQSAQGNPGRAVCFMDEELENGQVNVFPSRF